MCASPFEGTLFADSRETQQGAKEFAKNVYDVTLLFHANPNFPLWIENLL